MYLGMVDCRPEKSRIGGSIWFLTTMFSSTYIPVKSRNVLMRLQFFTALQPRLRAVSPPFVCRQSCSKWGHGLKRTACHLERTQIGRRVLVANLSE
jgi:hypothetical protein